SIPSEDPYEEAARQLLEQAPCPSEYVPDPMELEDHIPVYIPEPEHPDDLVPTEDEAPIKPYITEPGSTMAHRVDHGFEDTVDTRVRDTERRTMAAVEAQEDRAAVRAEIEILKRERLAYEQESIETLQALASYWIVSANVMNRSIGIDIPIRVISYHWENELMSCDSAVTYTSVHSKARSWSIPSEDPYEEAARQLLEQAPHPSKYVPDPIELEDHVPVYIPEPKHPKDLVPTEDEALIEPYITEVASTPTLPLPPPSLLPTLI
ncbi:hypothetical protein Tco_0851892, partial [Tanacetum coccineum]